MYFNTNNETGETLNQSRSRALSQEDVIYRFFMDNPREELTAFEVKAKLRMRSPITSIRRAITELTSKGRLEKLDKMKKGEYGKNCHCWRLKV
jgi:hypothetical protein